MKTLLVLLLLTSTGCRMIDQEKTLPIAAKSVAITAYSIVAALQTAAPDEPASDECINCNGTGKIGDGRIVKTCQVCNGTGKKKVSEVAASEAAAEAVEVAPKKESEVNHDEVKKPNEVSLPVKLKRVTVFIQPNSQPCDEWLAKEQERWQANGFEIVVKVCPGGMEVPWFLVEDGELKQEVGSELTWPMYENWRKAKNVK